MKKYNKPNMILYLIENKDILQSSGDGTADDIFDIKDAIGLNPFNIKFK